MLDRFSFRVFFIASFIASLAGLRPSTAFANVSQCLPQREVHHVRLADFESSAELVTPPAGQPVKALVILFAGSDVADMDSAIADEQNHIVSRPLREIADALSCAGYASFRYNKRWVTGATTVDRAKFDQLSGVDLANDGRSALRFAENLPAMRNVPTVLAGWSEGTTVAMAVAKTERKVRAVVLMAPVVESPAKTVQRQYLRVGRPYLETFSKDGALDADAIARASKGNGGVLAQIFVRMFKGFRPGEKINSLLDTDKNGKIEFSEADPIIASWYADIPNGGLGMSATGRALPGVSEAFFAGAPPILILQGLNDAMVDSTAATIFAAGVGSEKRVKIRTYSGLGHSLGVAPSMIEDQLLPVADQPLIDMMQWLDQTLTRDLRKQSRATVSYSFARK